jgi:hypothetical protein
VVVVRLFLTFELPGVLDVAQLHQPQRDDGDVVARQHLVDRLDPPPARHGAAVGMEKRGGDVGVRMMEVLVRVVMVRAVVMRMVVLVMMSGRR